MNFSWKGVGVEEAGMSRAVMGEERRVIVFWSLMNWVMWFVKWARSFR